MAIPAVGSELAGYRIDGLIGRGGMGVVYRGTDLRLGRRVAIKLIAAERAGEPEMRERFEREARLMAAIDHPNVVPVYAAGEDAGCLYLVMRYVSGTDLGGLLHQRGKLDPAHAVHTIEQLASALDAAHAAGLVHRDIKPGNVLLADDHVYLSDFGLGRAVETVSRLTDSNDWLGTVDFCSPEQLRCERVDARSDVYSLACLLHTALTGTPPHHRGAAAATMLAQLNDPPPPVSRTAGVPAALDPVLARALVKRPDDRYASAGELARAARAAIASRAPALGPDTRKSVRAAPHAPAPPPPHETVAARTRLLPAQLRTKLDLRPRPKRPGDQASHGTGRAVLGLSALLAALGAVVALLTTSSGPAPPGPLTSAELTGLVRSFAVDYGRRDPRALASLLAADVIRADAGAIDRGRPAVLATYETQLADGSIAGYRLAGLQVAPGWVGRVSAGFAILRIGRPTVAGRITFGIERIGGRPRIALITTQPSG